MKKIKLLTIAGSLVMASSLLLAPTVANAVIVASGTNCEAANLNQALQGIGWSQGGVKNNATSPFFVVCPMDWDSTNPNPHVVTVNASFPGSGVIECTARIQTFYDGSYTSITIAVFSGQGTGNANTGLNSAALTYVPGILNATLVCALDPGEGIMSLFYA